MNTLVIEKKDLVHNIQKIKEHISKNEPDDNGKQPQIIAVVKANAYGLDMEQYTKILIDNGITFFAVSTVDEALKFRKLGFTQKLLMLSSTAVKEDIKNLIENKVIITIGSKEAANAVEQIAQEINQKVKAHIKIDTGFGRYGFLYNQKEELIQTLKSLKNIKIEGTYTHFSNAFYDEKYTKMQFDRFIDCIEILKLNEINPRNTTCM